VAARNYGAKTTSVSLQRGGRGERERLTTGTEPIDGSENRGAAGGGEAEFNRLTGDKRKQKEVVN